MATFPHNLCGIRQDGHAEQHTPVVLRSEVERGVSRQRRTSADALVSVPCTLVFRSAAAAAEFEAWYYAEGFGWFDFTLPRTGAVVQARIVGGDIGGLTPITPAWNASERSITLEYIRPGFIQLAPGLHTVNPARILSVQRKSTATYVDEAGVLQTAAANVARWQGGQVLVEADGMNMATRSASPAGNWAMNGVSAGATVTAPDGTASAVQFLETNTGVAAGHQTNYASLGFEAGKRYVFSCYAAEIPTGLKRYTGILLVAGVFGAAGRGVYFDLASGAAGALPGVPVEYGAQQVGPFWRIWAGAVAESSGALAVQMRLSTTINGVSNSYIGDTSSGAILWGRQVEQLDAGGPTSFIYTTTAAAARAADLITVAA